MSEFNKNPQDSILISPAVADALSEYVDNMISDPVKASLDVNQLPEMFVNCGKSLKYLFEIVSETKAFAYELSKGNLNCYFPAKGNKMAAPLKSLHAVLRHLTWQTQEVAKGNYNQRVDFMGDFSSAFNEMIRQLKEQKKNDQEEKSKLEQYVLLILESCTNPLLVFDDQNQLVYVSNSWFRYCKTFSEESVEGKQMHELFSPFVSGESLKEIMDMYETSITEKQVLEAELDIDFGYHESCGHFRIQFTPMLEADGKARSVMVFLFDLTESELARRDAEYARELAEQSSRAKTNFLARMSHELRTPMNAILGIAQIELQKGGLPDEYAAALDKIYSSGVGLLGIINDILDMSKVETGKMELNPAEYDTPSLINDAVQLNIVQIDSRSIEFKLDIDKNLPLKIIGDELRIKQILNNLLSNAIKYTNNGYVKLSVKHSMQDDDLFLHFSVEDTGQGIKPEDQNKLFSEYLRFDNNVSSEGTGLGLSITKKLVKMMEGSIEFKSEYGRGSTFAVKIKQKAAGSKVIGAELSESLQNFTYSSKRQDVKLQVIREPMPYGKVLVVDDVESNLYVAKGLLASYGLTVDTALSGFAAIEKIEARGTYDIVFMDHMMPEMDGVETTQKLRAKGYCSTIVALTANALAGNKEMFMQNGFDDFISKPIDIQHLNIILNKYVRDKHPEEAAKYKALALEITQSSTSAITPKLIEMFCRDAEKAVKTLRETAARGDIKLFTTTVHAMKSALANIGEEDKSALALALEEAGRKGDKAFIDESTESFVQMLENMIENLQSSETDDDNANIQEDTIFLKEQLLKIKTACENYDDAAAYASLDMLKKKQWKKETSAALEKIRDMLFLDSDFEAAAEQVQILLDQN
ncbi:MAG: ATP-binding protein [Spirochaetes bacterium]|nr:ATP-binding protein [Spirochaetota bacterium]